MVGDFAATDISATRVSALLRQDSYLALLVEFGTATVPLSLLADKYFGLSIELANEKARAGSLGVPAFRCGSQKSAFLVHAQDLADYIDMERARARRVPG